MPLNNSPHKKYRTARLLLWVALLVSNLLCLQAVSQAAQWTTEKIDDPRFYMNFPYPIITSRNLAIANDGSINILYGEVNGDILIAKKLSSSESWQYISVYKDDNTGGAVFPSYAFDAQSRPHVTYTEHFNTGDRTITSAVLNSNNWQVETVNTDVEPTCLFAGSIAVDDFANEHILYSATASPDAPCRLLKYAYKSAGQWSFETIDTGESVSIRPKAMTLDSSGSPHIIYTADNGTSYELRYAVKIAGVWQITVISTDVENFSAYSLFLDSNDRPHITYPTAYPDNFLKYAFYEGSGWHIQDVGVSAWDSSLALDTNARPHVSYRGVNNSGLFYTFYDGVNWQITNIDTGDYSGTQNSIAIDSQANIHISYVDAEHDAVKYALFKGQGWQIETVDIWRRVSGESIALDTLGKPHISYSYGSSEIQYAYHDGVKWQIQTIFTGKHGEYVAFTSLALDLQNHPHVSFYDWDNKELKYGVNDGSGWSFSTVNSIGNAYSLPLSMALGTNSIPHIAYFDETNNLIKYSSLENNSWMEEDINLPFVPTQGYYSLSLLFDSLSQPHILYRIDTSLYYTFKNQAGWQTELVSNKANSWTNGFALDKSSKPFVTFAYQYDDNFWYGYRDDTGWNFEEIGIPGKDRGYGSSLVLDKMGRPHISYSYSDYELNEYFLKHAYHDGDAWQIDVVKSATSPYSIDSIISRTGKLHISYSDNGKGSLEYATASFPYPKFPWWSFWPTIMKAAQDRAKQ